MKYIEKKITNDAGVVANAWRGLEVVINLETAKAHVKQGGWTKVTQLKNRKPQAVPPVMWLEPDVWDLECAEAVFTEIATRMVTMEKAPDGSDNPFYGGEVKDVE